MVGIQPPPTPAAFVVPWRHETTKTNIRHIAGWTLRIDADVFSGRLKCQIYRHDIQYRRGALVFRFARDVDTSTAIYRIDGGEPNWTQSDTAELAQLGFALHDDDNLSNPSGGVLRVPVHKVGEARSVSVEVSARFPPVAFRVEGISSAVAAAYGAGCMSADFD